MLSNNEVLLSRPFLFCALRVFFNSITHGDGQGNHSQLDCITVVLVFNFVYIVLIKC